MAQAERPADTTPEAYSVLMAAELDLGGGLEEALRQSGPEGED